MILRFLSGRYESAEFPVGKGTIRIGRDPHLEMVLNDGDVDSAHARITLVDGALWLEDLGSTHGTFVNDRRIGRVTLAAGDRIVIGAHVMELRAS